MVAQTPAFKKAIDDSRNLKSKPTDDDLLELYALFKVGTGEDHASAAKPGMFDLKGKAKYNAWTKVVDQDKLSSSQAQTNYVQKVESLKKVHGF
ncbi:uncharacterized protein KY384_003427 [Bacidia gigantensis]|uniref:uncharacterized protein n=1 Tax=Bacidia gigantensis TaxID=2732470 RepID=UPI001D0452E1|nr:uncharacterized protein KY384_003427 [Bacidia gigantensis]KAG8531791.1 hypothetical protein KY384_003427 [Bacidia gigantensis]